MARRWLIALCIFLLVFGIPLLDLVALASSATILQAAANAAASAAATQRRYENCLSVMERAVDRDVHGRFAKFVNMRPLGGYQNSGADLFVDASSFVGGKINRIGEANTPVPKSIIIDTSVNVYECKVQLNFRVEPLINLVYVPLFGELPGIGKSVILSPSASKPSEYPRGLAAPTN